MNKTDKSNRPLVFVRCMTYNHESYIEDALDGFATQQTSFPFVVAVVDDASTDNNAQVITKWVSEHCDRKENYYAEEKDYGRVIHAQANDNPNCLFYVILLKENHFRKKPKNVYYAQYENDAKYVAMCEGDDYWTDPYKLQKQVVFLENHIEYGACCTRYYCYFEDTKELEKKDRYEYIFNDSAIDGITYTQENYFEINNIPQTLTMVYRNGLIPPNDYFYKLKNMQDDAQYYCMTRYGKIWLMNQVTGVYRKHEGSMTSEVGKRGKASLCKMVADIYRDMYQYDKFEPLRLSMLSLYYQYNYLTIKYSQQDSFARLWSDWKMYKPLTKSIKERYKYINKTIRSIVVRIIKRPYTAKPSRNSAFDAY